MHSMKLPKAGACALHESTMRLQLSDERCLTFAVADVEHEPALEAISSALDIEVTADSCAAQRCS